MLFRSEWWKMWLLASSVFFFVGKLHSQPIGIRSEYYTLEDGLSDRVVTNLHYLESGFLWVATENGLNRFDRYEFLTFNNREALPQRISESNIRQMLIDKAQQLVLTYNNSPHIIDIFHPETTELTTIKLSALNGVKGIPRGIFSDRDHNIFFLTLFEDGIRIYELYVDGAYEEVFFLAESHENTNIDLRALHLMDGTFLINDKEKGLRWFSKSGDLLQSFKRTDFGLSSSSLYPNRSNILYEDIKGRIWMSFHKVKGLFRWQPLQDTASPVTERNMDKQYAYAWEDPEGNVLFAETDGIGFFPDVTALHLINLKDEWMDFSFLLKEASKIITVTSPNSFFEDLYLGMETGLKVVNNRRSKVKTLLADDLPDYLRGIVIRGIEEDKDGTIYFAREIKNWFRWNPKEEKLDTIILTDSLTNQPLSFNCSFNIQFDHQKEYLWGISCNAQDEGQLHKMNPQTGKVITYRFQYKFTDLFVTERGLIWVLYTSQIGTSGLLAFDPATERFSTYFESAHNIMENAYPRFVLEDSKGLLWIGTNNGLFSIDPVNHIHKRYDQKSTPQLTSNYIIEIHEDKDGRLWLGTTGGINILDPNRNSVEVYSMNDGLPNNTICGFVPDEKDNYWVATFNGLSYFNTQNRSFKNFFKEDGLSENEFNRFSYHRAQDGRLYFGTVNGLNIIDPEELLNDSTNTDIFLTKYTTYDRRKDKVETQYMGLNGVRCFTISPYVPYFQFDFALTNFVNPDNNRYAAWLEGVEKDYSYLGKSNYVRYYKVPAGKHRLHIRGANANGNWSDPLIIEIEVKKFFYQQTWFVVLIIVAVGLIAYVLSRFILSQQIRMERLRTKISSDLHDEVSGLLAGIAIQSDILKLKNQNEESRRKLGQIGEVSRKAISKMSDVIWSIDSRNDRVEDLLQRMKEHLAEVLEPKDVDYYIETLRINPKAKIPVNIRQDLYLIFKEAVNNIAKHSDATEVRIRVFTEGKKFKMTIQDNGSGRKRQINGYENGKKGQGMANMRMRAHRLKGELVISDRKGYMINLSIKKFG